MSETQNHNVSAGNELIAERYLVEKKLGGGGMALVFRVKDTSTGEHLALKRISLPEKDRKHRQTLEKLFEAEFHSLAQLAHPRVVAVKDYGRDDAGPFYTMELVEGNDLRNLSPLPWREACSYLRDVCSALSLLHSRRLLHRDLSPNNIRCIRHVEAKLIDFGAMSPMGPCKHILGTPPFTAPEVLNLQILDARTDLYSLGATAYYALTGKHAFPARKFKDLRQLWRDRLQSLSKHVPDIPRELDELVLSLLSLSPLARPLNAAEVMERLTAIAGLRTDEQLAVSESYLSAPQLVGRESLLLRVRKQLARAQRKRGGTIVITGEPGVGRSRFLDACVLEGKLLGAVVLKADATDAASGKWGIARALSLQLLDSMPQFALETVLPESATIGHILPELFERTTAKSEIKERPYECGRGGADLWHGRLSSAPPPRSNDPSKMPLEHFENPEELRPRLHLALSHWLVSISRKTCLVIAVDDFHKVDEPSAALLALLSEVAKKNKLVVAITAETATAATSLGALGILMQAGHCNELQRLDENETEELLQSVFGEVAHVQLLANRLHALSRGNPREIMWIAQHLVDKGAIEYSVGSWSLPANLDKADLPASLTDALLARVSALKTDARLLGQAMALCPELSFEFEECLALTAHGSRAQLARSIEDLIAAQILVTDGYYYSLAHQGWVPVLKDGLLEVQEQEFYRRIARMLDERKGEFVRVAGYLMKSGAGEQALDVILANLQKSRERHQENPTTFSEHIDALPSDWIAIYEGALDWHKRLGRPLAERYLILYILNGISSLTHVPSDAHFNAMLELLVSASGLSVYYELGETMEATERLQRALETAQRRYDASPKSECVMEPAKAIRELAIAVSQGISKAISTWDNRFLQNLPSLKPYVPLSPAIGIIEKIRQAVGYGICGYHEKSLLVHTEILTRIAEPDGAGLPTITRNVTKYGSIYASGAMHGWLGHDAALEHAAELEKDPLQKANAWSVRALYFICRGNVLDAVRCSKNEELIQIRNRSTQIFSGIHHHQQLIGYSQLDYLTGIKQTLKIIRFGAERFEGWKPYLFFAEGEYSRLRSNEAEALVQYEKCLNSITAGSHTVWCYAAGAYVRTFYHMGRLDEAKARGTEFLKQAEAAGLGYVINSIRIPLAWVLAKLGDLRQAVRLAQEAVDLYEGLETRGVAIGYAAEVRARLAMVMDDYESFAKYISIAAEQYRESNSAKLLLRYEKLLKDGFKFSLHHPEDERVANLLHSGRQQESHYLTEVLKNCSDGRQRVEHGLKALVRECRAQGGFLYTMQAKGLEFAGSCGPFKPLPDMVKMASDYLASELADTGIETQTIDDSRLDETGTTSSSDAWLIRESMEYHSVTMGHFSSQDYLITGLVVFIFDPLDGENRNLPYRSIQLLSKTLAKAHDTMEFSADQFLANFQTTLPR